MDLVGEPHAANGSAGADAKGSNVRQTSTDFVATPSLAVQHHHSPCGRRCSLGQAAHDFADTLRAREHNAVRGLGVLEHDAVHGLGALAHGLSATERAAVAAAAKAASLGITDLEGAETAAINLAIKSTKAIKREDMWKRWRGIISNPIPAVGLLPLRRPSQVFLSTSDLPLILCLRRSFPIRKRYYDIVNNPGSSRKAALFLALLASTIFVSLINRHLATTLRFRNNRDASDATLGIELACTVFFCIELSLRIFATSVDPVKLLLCDGYFWIDLMAIIPNVIEWVDHAIRGNLDPLPTPVRNTAALMRMLRILKLMRHYTDWRVLIVALRHVRSVRIRPLRSPFLVVLTRVQIPPMTGGAADSDPGVRDASCNCDAVGGALDC